VLLPLFTGVGMDRCEGDVIIACGLYLLVEEEKRKKKKKKENAGFIRCCEQEKKEGEFHSLFGRLKDGRQKFFKYFRMSFPKFENLKLFLHTEIEKKYTRWRWSIRTEERLTLTVRLVNKNV
jgi:hypothetical protein